ncbi:adenylyltransferase/cytidyltransferase family protein [Flavobacteriaceae bacterium]|nr:adenylyltransferase/cytidyltransferase family protein [Flavobacteriaceae bacterium]
MEKKYLLSLITKFSNIQLSIIDSNSFSIHSTSTFTDNIFKLFDELFLKYGDTISIIFNNNSMVTVCNNVSEKKYKIMYTTGCFDIFHYGHLNILSKSKDLCQKLIVGVSTDELILKEKGKLPVIPFLERVKIVESIKYVDMVVPQTNKNKQEAIDKYNIDAISVGDDWKGRYPKTSCPVEYFTYTPNVSSTILKGLLSNSKI